MFRPMLSPNDDPLKNKDYFKRLRYPLLCSPKYDGIRAIVKNFTVMSRTFKPLPSYQVQDEFNGFEHFDGEIIEGNPTDFDVYNRTQSYVMSEDKPGNLGYYVFDYTHPQWLDKPFYIRLEKALELITALNDNRVKYIHHQFIDNYDELIEYEQEILQQGFEGIMMRNPIGHYKNGRGTFNEGLIYKLKRFQDAEGVIIDFEERMINQNELEKDDLGYAKRSYKKEGMVPGNILGNFIVDYNGQHISVAPGCFTHDDLYRIWNNQSFYYKKLLKFRFFGHGIKDKPRFPRAVGFRSEIDV